MEVARSQQIEAIWWQCKLSLSHVNPIAKWVCCQVFITAWFYIMLHGHDIRFGEKIVEFVPLCELLIAAGEIEAPAVGHYKDFGRAFLYLLPKFFAQFLLYGAVVGCKKIAVVKKSCALGE